MVGPNNFISSFGRALVGGITQGLVIDRVEILPSAVGVTYNYLVYIYLKIMLQSQTREFPNRIGLNSIRVELSLQLDLRLIQDAHASSEKATH